MRTYQKQLLSEEIDVRLEQNYNSARNLVAFPKRFIFKGQTIFTISRDLIISPFNQYWKRDIFTKILEFDYKVNDFEKKTINIILFLLFQKHSDTDDIDNNNFFKEYLNLFENDKKSSLIWWNSQDIQFLQKNLYQFDKSAVDKFIEQNEVLIRMVQDVLQFSNDKYGLQIDDHIKQENQIRLTFSFLYSNMIFIKDQPLYENEHDYPIIIPLYFQIFRWGPARKAENINKKCKTKSGILNQYYVTDDKIKIFSDCDFSKNDEIFILDRDNCGLDELMNKGFVNDNTDGDLIRINIEIDKLEEREQEVLLEFKLITEKQKFLKFQFDNFGLNNKFLQYLSVIEYLNSNPDKRVVYQDFANENQEILIKKAQIKYLRSLETLFPNISSRKISEDYKDFIEFRKNKKLNREQFFTKNVYALRFLQRRTIEAQIYMISKQILQNDVLFLENNLWNAEDAEQK